MDERTDLDRQPLIHATTDDLAVTQRWALSGVPKPSRFGLMDDSVQPIVARRVVKAQHPEFRATRKATVAFAAIDRFGRDEK